MTATIPSFGDGTIGAYGIHPSVMDFDHALLPFGRLDAGAIPDVYVMPGGGQDARPKGIRGLGGLAASVPGSVQPWERQRLMDRGIPPGGSLSGMADSVPSAKMPNASTKGYSMKAKVAGTAAILLGLYGLSRLA